MFRRLEESLPVDPTYPTNLTDLGFFVDKHGCVRNITAPDTFFNYRITNSDRHNEMRAEALHFCLREQVQKRLSALGLKELYLPHLTLTKPSGPHVPILLPDPSVLRTRKRIVVLINDSMHNDLGILAYRLLAREPGLNGGSVINFAKELASRSPSTCNLGAQTKLSKDGAGIEHVEHAPGLVVLNTAQLLYSHKFNNTLSFRSWNCLPRPSRSHGSVQMHAENEVPGHGSPEEHVRSVFETVVLRPEYVAADAEIYIVAIEKGFRHLLDALKRDFSRYAPRIAAVAIINANVQTSEILSPDLKNFLHARARLWQISSGTADPLQCLVLPSDYNDSRKALKPTHPSGWQGPVDWFERIAASAPGSGIGAGAGAGAAASPLPKTTASSLTSPTDFLEGDDGTDVICPTFGGGDTASAECIFPQPSVQAAILSFFDDVARKGPGGYHNPVFEAKKVEEGGIEWM